MKLVGQVEIFGMPLRATVEIIDAPKSKGKGVTYIKAMEKYKAYGYDAGKIQFYGYYDTEAEATEAARQRRNLAREKKGKTERGATFSSGVTYDARANTWRIKMTIGGARVSLGRYATYGNAVLVRDVVARRSGGHVVVADYSMPLALVTDAVARSYITDRILPATADDLAEYQRRVDELNRTVTGAPETSKPVAPPTATLPPETWRQKQPSRPGHAERAGLSPFDTLDT